MKNLKLSSKNHAYITALAVVKYKGNADDGVTELIKAYEETNPAVAADIRNYLQLQKTIIDEKLKYER